MTKRIFIFGTSGFSREVNDIAAVLGYEGIFIAEDELDRQQFDGDQEVITEDQAATYRGEAFAIGIGDNAVRKKIASRYASELSFPTLIHPSATFGRRQFEMAECTQGSIICAGVRVTNNVVFGNFCIVNLNATIGHDVVLENYVNIAPGANISGNVLLSNGVWVGTGATVNQGRPRNPLVIGAHTTIGSGSVVVKSCDANAVYVGVPAGKRA